MRNLDLAGEARRKHKAWGEAERNPRLVLSRRLSAIARFACSSIPIRCQPGVALRFTPGFMLPPLRGYERAHLSGNTFTIQIPFKYQSRVTFGGPLG
jgi:hypothetical protein